MAITIEDIKLMASQRLSDTEDGGGMMTGNEIVDGNINNLFPDISRLDRVYGRVSLRKAFASVQTPNNDAYSGAHIILSEPAADPHVNVTLFTTDSQTDQRAAARDYMESYVVVGPRWAGWLWSDHPAGSRALLLFAVKNTPPPEIGEVFYLSGGVGQYVRVVSVEVSKAELNSTSTGTEYGATAMAFSRDIFKVYISEPLREKQTGPEISKDDSKPTSVYTTVVHDAAKYYGVMLPTAAIEKDDIAINVNSIFTHLVPSSQGESPIVDLSVGETTPLMQASTVPYTVTKASFVMAAGAQLHFGRGIYPGSLEVTWSGRTYTDDGKGILYEGSTQRGSVDYEGGVINFTVPGVTGTSKATATAMIGAGITRVCNSLQTAVTISNQGYNYTAILEPLPTPGTVFVDYMSQGKWYRLRDNRKGELVPDVQGTGTGTVNYSTGSVILTCAALPDVETSIMFLWGTPLEASNISGSLAVDVAEVTHTVQHFPVRPGSVVITWPSGAGTATATDNGSGAITGAATGSINYGNGEIRWTPTQLPVSGAAYTIDYDKYPNVVGVATLNGAGGVASGNLSQYPVKPGSVSIAITLTFHEGSSHNYLLRDNGGGGLSAGGANGVGEDSTFYHVSRSFGGVAGTIDYITGAITVNYGAVTGFKEEKTYKYRWGVTAGNWDNSSVWHWLVLDQDKSTNLTGASVAAGATRFALASSAIETNNETTPAKPAEINIMRNVRGRSIVPSSLSFTWGGARYTDRLGKLYRSVDPATGNGVEAGSINYSTGLATIDTYDSAPNTLTVHSCLVRFGRQFLPSVTFRTPGAPVRPGGLQIQGVTHDGQLVSGASGADGTITGDYCDGKIDYSTGVVVVNFGELVVASGNESEPWYDLSLIEGGMIWKPVPTVADQLVYTCVIYSYIPLDADLLGIDPVRLPSDGRVPIVKPGYVVVLHNTQTTQLPAGLTAGQQLTLPRPDINHVELYDANDQRVLSTKFTWDEDDQKITMATPLDLTGYAQPLVAMHRIEDMRLVSQVQINGQVILNSGVSHDYAVSGTYVSSALLFGDQQSRYYGFFDQKTWTNEWSDALVGDAANATYNELNYPLLVTNQGAIKERWALVFTAADHFYVMGEHVGILGSYYITQDCQPINPATNQPFFFIDYRGWGTGWAAGNVIRFNTEGASPDFWIARTTLQGPVTEPNDQFTIQIRGDAE